MGKAIRLLTLVGTVAMLCACPPGEEIEARYDPAPDAEDSEILGNFSVRSRWQKDALTYFIESYSNDMNQQDQRDLVVQALAKWRAVVPLEFQEVNSKGQADIIVGFGSGDHCGLYQVSLGGDECFADAGFDGESGVLAHCYYPNQGNISGDAHFDDDETYTADNGSTTEVRFLEVATHEFGHGLGLDHSDDQNAIMFPSYSGGLIKLNLGSDDIAGIQSLYGARDGSAPPDSPGTPDFPDDEPVPVNPNNPSEVDSDGDMLTDEIELYYVGTDPRDDDTDGDGLIDYEVVFGLNPLNADTDGDGVDDLAEIENGTDPLVPNFGGGGGAPAGLIGYYIGFDQFDSLLEFEVYSDGSVLGFLTYLQYGYTVQVPLYGAIDGTGFIAMVSGDYFFYLEGQVFLDGSAGGTLSTAGGAFINWIAEYAQKKLTKSESESLLSPDGTPNSYQPVPDEKSDQLHPIHSRVNWRLEHAH